MKIQRFFIVSKSLIYNINAMNRHVSLWSLENLFPEILKTLLLFHYIITSNNNILKLFIPEIKSLQVDYNIFYFYADDEEFACCSYIAIFVYKSLIGGLTSGDWNAIIYVELTIISAYFHR